jgi:Flp pilus assembly protein protease CpaA
LVIVIVSMAFVEDVRSQLIPSLISLAVVLAAAFLRHRAAGRATAPPDAGGRAASAA